MTVSADDVLGYACGEWPVAEAFGLPWHVDSVPD